MKQIFEYRKQKRDEIYRDEFQAYKLLIDIYKDNKIPKKMFWLAAGITTAMLTYSYLSLWTLEGKIEKKLFEGLEEKLDDR